MKHSERCVIEFGSYRVAVRPGTSRRLIVSLAGLDTAPPRPTGALPAMRRAFQGTFSRILPADHLVFVQDANHSWFNDTLGFQDLVGFIEAYVADLQIEETVAIGFSMGATGAIVLDAVLRFDRVVGLVPQALVGSAACPWDQRYLAAWARIASLPHARVAPLLRNDGDHLLLVPIDIAEDVRHAAELSRSAGAVEVFATRCGEHNILEELRRSGRRDAFVQALIAGESDLRRFGYHRVAADTLATLDLLLGDGPEAAPPDDVYAFAEAHPRVLPTCLYRILRDAEIARALAAGKASATAFPTHARHVCRPEELRRYACEGWFAYDQGFTWSEGIHHFVRFRVLDFADHHEVRTRLFFLPFVNERHSQQRVAFFINGRLACEATAEAGTPSATRLEIVLTLEEACNEIHIVTPDCVSPARLGIGDDPRPIALSFNHMLLESEDAARSDSIGPKSARRFS